MAQRSGKPPSRAAIAGAIAQLKGNLSAVAAKFGVARCTIYEWLAGDAELQRAVTDAREAMLDLAESKLEEAIDAGQGWAIALALKTVGKQRGYVERVETEHRGRVPLEVVLDLGEGAGEDTAGDAADGATAPLSGEPR